MTLFYYHEGNTMADFQAGDTAELVEDAYDGLVKGDRVQVRHLVTRSSFETISYTLPDGRLGAGFTRRFKKVEPETTKPLPTWVSGSLLFTTIVVIGLVYHYFAG